MLIATSGLTKAQITVNMLDLIYVAVQQNKLLRRILYKWLYFGAKTSQRYPLIIFADVKTQRIIHH